MIGRSEYCLGNIADEKNDLIELIRQAQENNEAKSREVKLYPCAWFMTSKLLIQAIQ